VKREAFFQGLAEALEWTGPQLSDATVLRGHDLWDSMGKVATMLFLDEDLGVAVSDADLERVTTVADVIELVRDHVE
jgi:acyl carrier protein